MRYSLLLLMSICCLTGCLSSNQKKQLVAEYQGADLVKPNIITKEYDNSVVHFLSEWDEIVFTPEKQKVQVLAKEFPGFVHCIYDGVTIYKVYEYADYMDVSELRISPDQNVLYVKIEGMFPKLWFNWDETWLYVFDLEKRKHLHRIKVDDL